MEGAVGGGQKGGRREKEGEVKRRTGERGKKESRQRIQRFRRQHDDKTVKKKLL